MLDSLVASLPVMPGLGWRVFIYWCRGSISERLQTTSRGGLMRGNLRKAELTTGLAILSCWRLARLQWRSPPRQLTFWLSIVE